MTTQKKIAWLEEWCKKEGLHLVLEGECGFGRDCVGVISSDEDAYPDYTWYDAEYNRADTNGKVWTPENAYHKHPCTAVLGRGDDAIGQLYVWCKWFEDNDFHYEVVSVVCTEPFGLALGRDKQHRMVRNSKGDQE